jgi:hypothetical protein
MSRVYTAQAPRSGAADAVLIDDRWRFWAFVVPVLWALWGRHWMLAVALVVWTGAVGAAAGAGFLAQAALADLALRLALGLEGGAAARLDRRLRGWREAGAVAANDDEEAEILWAARIGALHGPWGRPA